MTNSGPSFFILLLPRSILNLCSALWCAANASVHPGSFTMCLRVNVGKFFSFPKPWQSLGWENLIDSLPALTLSFTEEHLQGHGSHTLRTLLFPFVGIERGNTHINSWMLMKDLTMCARRSMNTLSHTLMPWIMKTENFLSLQLLHFSIFGEKHKDRNKASIRNHYRTYLGIHFFESREINLMARHELQDWLHWNLVDFSVCQLMHKSSPSIVTLEIALQKAGVVEFNSVVNYWSISSDPWGICLLLKIIMHVTVREWKCKMGNLLPENP